MKTRRSRVSAEIFHNHELVNAAKTKLLLYVLTTFLVACGGGNNDSGAVNNYYSASSSTYYQIESQSSESVVLNIITNSGNNINDIPLTATTNGYAFSASIYGKPGRGSIVLKNNLMGISFSSNNGSGSLALADFATTVDNTNTEQIPDGTYTTICDRNNISACTMVVTNNKISVTEYNTSAMPTTLCSNQPLTIPENNLNPFLLSFSCGVQGGTYTGTWHIMPLIINDETALMVNEYNASVNAPDSLTNEIAFLQAAFIPSGTYNYVYNGITNSQAGIGMANFANNSLINTVAGSCSGAACALINGQYFGTSDILGNPMIGFDYYSVNGAVNYNLVGSTKMNLFVDSFSGIYY